MLNENILSEIVGKDTYGLYFTENKLIYCYDFDNGTMEKEINVYELMSMCKKWAYNKYHLTIWSAFISNLGKAEVFDVVELLNDFGEDTEYESVFKACEWLKDNR